MQSVVAHINNKRSAEATDVFRVAGHVTMDAIFLSIFAQDAGGTSNLSGPKHKIAQLMDYGEDSLATQRFRSILMRRITEYCRLHAFTTQVLQQNQKTRMTHLDEYQDEHHATFECSGYATTRPMFSNVPACPAMCPLSASVSEPA